jgi:hypothetical protein
VQLVIKLLKFALDTAGPDGMSPLSSPYERKDLPVAQQQSWKPVPPFIPRIQREKLCSHTLHGMDQSSSATAAITLASKVAEPIADDATLSNPPQAAVDGALSSISSMPAWRIDRDEGQLTLPPSHELGHGIDQRDDQIIVQQLLSTSKGSIVQERLLTNNSVLAVLSWQIVFSGALTQPPSCCSSLSTPIYCSSLSIPSYCSSPVVLHSHCFLFCPIPSVGGLSFFAVMAFKKRIADLWWRSCLARADQTVEHHLQMV